MSEPTYRIDLAHEPSREDDNLPYIARAVRLSDDERVASAWGPSPEEAVSRVRSWIVAQSAVQAPQTFYVDDEGNFTDEYGNTAHADLSIVRAYTGA